ncbi:MAG: hypothetical protein K8R21_15630 [Leptospira sp.]|nr:hypothetical protein [Leptospira sp.]
MTEAKINTKPGIKNGFLWAILSVSIYLYSFFAIGAFLIWNTNTPESTMSTLAVVGSSLLYLLVGVIGLIPILLFAIFLVIKDTSIYSTVRKYWPILLALLYPFLPNLPGPIDEFVVETIAVGIQVYLSTRKHKAIAIEGKPVEKEINSPENMR